MTAWTKGAAQDEPQFTKVTMAGPFYANVLNNVTAKASGGQSGATPLTGDINIVATVATAGDSVLLPFAEPGRELTVTNASANSLNVFPYVGDKVNALSVNAAYAVAAGKTATLFSAAAGQWYALLSA